ncbi:C3a anaphylatoxin chemotactic receptor [Esox lucius]|uniref:G-protein coupled receptors family 1 profile domain-containing protein n=1 Tax=Esox lucius TaxID=8010 RepID=A0AAY5LA93_ESOLU|nr:C3a anaphylatoxin chemotactic receptor [Esox lucius]
MSDEMVTNDYWNYSYTDGNSSSPTKGQENNSIRVVSLVLYSVACLLGIPGNAFVIWIAGIKMKRTINTVWFVSLALADLFCCISLPFSIAHILLDYHWIYGNAMCKFIPSVIVLNMFASVFTLMLISLDRFALVILPVWSQNNRSIPLALLLCGLAWIMAFLLTLPSMIYRELLVIDDINLTLCTYNDSNQSAIRASFVARLVLGFLVPLLVITLCHLLIGRRVSSSRFKSRRAFRIILGVVVAFFVCWLPYHVIGMVMEYGGEALGEVAQDLDPLAVALAFVNSCLNPVLYVFMGQDFRARVRVSLRKIFENVFSEDGNGTVPPSGYSIGQSQLSQATHSSEAQVEV